MLRHIDGTKLNRAAFMCTGWFPVVVFSIFIKKVNIELKYFDLFHKFSDSPSHPLITDYLAIYRYDLLYSCMVMPLLIIGFACIIPRKTASVILSSLTLLLMVLLFGNLHSWGTLGRPLSFTAFYDAAVFAMQTPRFISLYVNLGSWMKLFVLVTSSLAGYFVMPLIGERFRVLNKLTVILIVLYYIVFSALFLASFKSTMKDARIFRNFITLSLVSFLEMEQKQSIKPMTLKESIDAFYKLTHTVDSGTSAFRNKSKGNDLIVFVLETGPSAFIDLKNDIHTFKSLEKMKRHALISYEHYSTYPGSSQALFSLFVSVYPPRSYYESCIAGYDKSPKVFPGFVSKFRGEGYKTHLYLPYDDVIPIDTILHNNLGFDSIFYGSRSENSQERSCDLIALDKLKEDMIRHIENHEPYVSVFLPQSGHAPWDERPDSISIREYGRKLAVMQDEWIGEVMDILKRKNRLKDTVIVFTADHGIRTSIEDPSFNMGFIDSYSYQVPLLIYSESAFKVPYTAGYKTSHLDISPSLIDMFGLSSKGLIHQGLRLWDRNAGSRDLYFLGHWYCNVDGYYHQGLYYMYNDILDLSFQNTALSFGFSNIVHDMQLNGTIRKNIDTIYGIQENLYNGYFGTPGNEGH